VGPDRAFCYVGPVFECKKSATILLLALIGTAGIAGCGGGDEEEPEAPAPVETTVEESPELTMDELVNQGDEYCAEANSSIGTINASTADESLKESQVASVYSGLASDLESLGAPTEGEAPTDVIEAAGALAEADSTTADSALATFQSAADSYGFAECGEAPAAPASGEGSTGVPVEPGTDPSGGYVEPAPAPVEPAPAPVEPTPPPSSGGGVTPTPPPATGGGSSGGSSSGGISPG